MIVRLAALFVMLWALGLALFAILLPGPADDRTTDAIVVVTGGAGRIERGLRLLEAGKAKRVLVAGVDRRVRPEELAAEYHESVALFRRKITLGQESVDTRSNALEAAEWLRRNRYRSVRLVTNDWHMPRARFELARVIDPDMVLVADAVPSEPSFGLLLREYNKYLLRHAAAPFGV